LFQHIKLLSLFSFFTNKNLFLERFSFLKSLKRSTQNIIYVLHFVFSKYVVLMILIGALYFFKLSVIVVSIILIIHLLLKLLTLDIDDWQLYFKDDIKLAIPEHSRRYLTVLLSNIIYKFFCGR